MELGKHFKQKEMFWWTVSGITKRHKRMSILHVGYGLKLCRLGVLGPSSVQNWDGENQALLN